jgi:hypothetical protein
LLIVDDGGGGDDDDDDDDERVRLSDGNKSLKDTELYLGFSIRLLNISCSLRHANISRGLQFVTKVNI